MTNLDNEINEAEIANQIEFLTATNSNPAELAELKELADEIGIEVVNGCAIYWQDGVWVGDAGPAGTCVARAKVTVVDWATNF
jgi:hypothetical protein